MAVITRSLYKVSTGNKELLNKTLTILYFFALFWLNVFAVFHWILSNSWYVIFPLGIPNNFFEIPARPFSLILFSIVGLIIYWRYRGNAFHAILMLGFTYAGWEVVQSIFDPLVYLYNGTIIYRSPSPVTLGLWLAVMVCAYCFVIPRINFTNWAMVACFLYYANGDYLLGFFGGRAEGSFTDAIYSIGTILVWSAFILKSFSPKIRERYSISK